MSDIEVKRDFVRNMYGSKWKKRVDKMSNEQIVAIYIHSKRYLERHKEAKRTLKKDDPPPF